MAKAEKGGGKLGRSETVTIRLDPKSNYMADLAARSQRRTKSSLIEAALADAMNIILVDVRPHVQDKRTIAQIADAVWHVDEIERLRRLVEVAPHLMSYDEQKIWAVLEKNAAFWLGDWIPIDEAREYYSFSPHPSQLFMWEVEKNWTAIKRVAAGQADPSILPVRATVRPRQQHASAASSVPLLPH